MVASYSGADWKKRTVSAVRIAVGWIGFFVGVLVVSFGLLALVACFRDHLDGGRLFVSLAICAAGASAVSAPVADLRSNALAGLLMTPLVLVPHLVIWLD